MGETQGRVAEVRFDGDDAGVVLGFAQGNKRILQRERGADAEAFQLRAAGAFDQGFIEIEGEHDFVGNRRDRLAHAIEAGGEVDHADDAGDRQKPEAR